MKDKITLSNLGRLHDFYIGVKNFKVASVLFLLLLLGTQNSYCQSQTINASGTFTVPSNVNIITVEAWGGGGRGATRSFLQSAGGGGGGGAYSRKTITVSPNSLHTVTIGAGSTTSGTPGGDTWFDSATSIMAKGGGTGSGTTPGAGGQLAAGFGDVKFSGGNGATAGGGSSAGRTANGVNGSGNTGGTATAGGGGGNGGNQYGAGSAPGGGGGGSGGLGAAPGSGGTGRIIVSWVLPTITSFTPSTICSAGSRNVSITGTNFTGATAVLFDGVNAESFVVNSSTNISAVAPLGVNTGTISVTIPDATGTSAGVFTVNQNPGVAEISGPSSVCLPISNTITLQNTTPTGTWSSSDVDIATVSASGIVTPVTEGNVIISYTVTDTGCSTIKTHAVAINTPVAIISSTATQSVVTNSNTFFTVNASGSPEIGNPQLTYQWEVTTDGENFTPLTNDGLYGGTNTATLTITAVPLSLNESLYHVIVTGACNTVTSDLAVLIVGDTGIETQPSNFTLCDSGPGTASFTVVGSADVTSYQWQEDQGGDNWMDLVDGGIYSGSTSATLSLTGLSILNSGWKYRAAVTGTATATSNAAILTVIEGAAFVLDPVDDNVCYTGGSASFSVSGSNVASYSWQYSSDNGANWSPVGPGIPTGTTYTGTATSILSINTTAAIPVGTHLYRAVANNIAPCTGSVSSAAAQLLIDTPNVSTQPVSATIGAGNSVTFSVASSSSSPTYQWQFSTTAGGAYLNVADGTPAGVTYSGENTANLTATVASTVAAGSARFYRAIISSPAGCSINSNSAQLTTTVYCTPTTSIGDATDIITNVVITNVAAATNITQASSGAAPWFTFYNNPPLNLTQGQIVTVAITFGPDNNQYSAVWIDYNKNGTFDASENVGLATAVNAGGTTRTYTFTIPFNASPGITRIRIRGASDSIHTVGGACTASNYGETEDYLLNIIEAPPCAGNPIAGTATASPVNVCISGTSTLTLTGYATGLTGIGIQWYNTVTGLISGATNPTYTTPAITANTSYFARVTCSNGGGFSDSNTVNVNYRNPIVLSSNGAQRCGPGSITINATGSAGSTIRWFAAPTGGTALSTGVSFTIPNLLGTTIYYAEANIGNCESAARTAVTATINPPPAITLSAGNAVTICSGDVSNLVTIISGIADYESLTWSSLIGVSGSVGDGFTFNPTVTTTYILSGTSVLSGCNNSISFTVNVNPLPAPLLLAPTTATSCSSENAVLLTATGGSITNVPILTETFDNNAPSWTITNGGSSPAATNWAFVSAPYNDTANTDTFLNFSTLNGGKFAMANGDAASLSTTNTIITSPVFSTVGYSAATLNFEHVYKAGVIDITAKVEISTNGTLWTQLATYASTTVGTITNNGQATVPATLNLSAYLNQPTVRIRYNYNSFEADFWIIDNVRITGTDPGKVTWSPQTGLYTNATATTPYTGAVTTTVYAKPDTPTTYTATVAALTTCDVSSQVTINTAIAATYYADGDGDGYGAGAGTLTCTPNSGWVLNNTDCNDGDDLVFQSGTFYIDADNDGYNNGAPPTEVCYGATSPLGYVAVDNGLDCNDNIAAINPGHVEVLYNGVDDNCNNQLDEGFQLKTKLLPIVCGTTLASIGSLIGITTVSSTITGYRIKVTSGAQVQIIERNVPHFTLPLLGSYDYATTYTVEIELQRNGIWLGYYGDPCLVSSPAVLAENGATQVAPSQCGITLPRINTLIATTSLQGATGYRFKVTNITDGASGPNVIQTIDRTLHWFSLPMLTQYNYGSTYRIEIAVKTNGVFSGFGAPCEVSSPPAPSLINCGGIIPLQGTLIAATSMQGVSQYRFQVTRMSDNATTTIDRNTNAFSFILVPAFTPGALYAVRVAVMSVGTWSPFGDACVITAPGGSARFISEPVDTSGADFKAAVHPNPFTSTFAIAVNSEAAMPIQIMVYDMTGKLIESRESRHSDLSTIQLGDKYPSGVYNVIVTQETNIKTLLVIKR